MTSPTIDDLDVSRPELYRDDTWHRPFRRLREASPIHRVDASGFGPYWSVSTYRPIVEVESLPALFSSGHGFNISKLPPEEQRTPMFIGMDPPSHTAQRRTVAPAFTPAEMQRLSAAIRQRTGELLDSLPSGTPFDWVDLVSTELTQQMLAILFDFPWNDRAKLSEWSDWMGDVELLKRHDTRVLRLERIAEAATYFQRLWTERSARAPTPDLISMMIHSEAMGRMSQREFMGTLVLLIVGGVDTTRNTMSGLVYALDRFPGEREKLEADRLLVPNAVSEIVRWQTPLAHMGRTATCETQLGGQTIAAGDKVVLWYISANRDESVFGPDADEFRVDRPNARRHLSFGHGIHRCVGARLADLQVRTLLSEMLDRGMRISVNGEPKRIPACFVHGYRSMPVVMHRTR